ncbi:hypothetical protein RCO48_26120 [Peribacillus frigoritolerans]|nr:hypothetical protein [Peribacillus frigoritolerans]
MERKVRDSCGNCESKETPTGASAPRADRRGKRVPEVEINVQICTSQKKLSTNTRFSSSLSTV